MEIVLAGGAAAIVLVVIITVVAMRRERHREAKGRSDLRATIDRGVEPVTLHPVVDLDTCIGTAACVDVCPEVDVLAVIDGKARLANPTGCIGHSECMRACPVDAITLVIGSEKRGVEIPLLSGDFESNVPGLYIVGELGGMGLVYNAMTQALQGMRAIIKTKPPRVEGVHQVVIIGAGPAGLAASLAAQDAGLDYVTVDQEDPGGTVLQYPRHKIVMTQPVKLPIYGTLKVSSVSKEELLAKWNEVIEKTGVQIRNHVKVEGVSKRDDGTFEVKTGNEVLHAQRVVLAMGRRGSPRKLGVPGEDLANVTYRLLEPENYAGNSCLVVGGGDSAVEAAIALGENGATTTLAYRRDSFGRIKPKNQKRLDAAVAAGQISLSLETSPVSIHADHVMLDIKGERTRLDNEYVLVFAGGVLPTKFLAAAGVEVQTFTGEAFAPANA